MEPRFKHFCANDGCRFIGTVLMRNDMDELAPADIYYHCSEYESADWARIYIRWSSGEDDYDQTEVGALRRLMIHNPDYPYDTEWRTNFNWIRNMLMAYAIIQLTK